MDNETLHWLAGLLEGEGSFIPGSPSRPNNPRISVQMTDEDVIARISEIFSRKYHRCAAKNPKYKPSFIAALTGSRAIALMKVLKPLMGKRRQQQIDKTIASYNPAVINRRNTSRQKLFAENLEWAKSEMKAGKSLRSVARELTVNHETLRQRLIHVAQ